MSKSPGKGRSSQGARSRRLTSRVPKPRSPSPGHSPPRLRARLRSPRRTAGHCIDPGAAGARDHVHIDRLRQCRGLRRSLGELPLRHRRWRDHRRTLGAAVLRRVRRPGDPVGDSATDTGHRLTLAAGLSPTGRVRWPHPREPGSPRRPGRPARAGGHGGRPRSRCTEWLLW